MTETQTQATRRLDEKIELLRGDLSGLRADLRSSLDGKAFRSEVESLLRYTDREFYHMGQRITSLETQSREDLKHKRQLTLAVITAGVGAMISLLIAFFG